MQTDLIQILIGVQGAALVVTCVERAREERIQRRVRRLEAELIRHESGLWMESALGVRLQPELEWADQLDASMSMLVIRAGHADGAATARAVGELLRAHEHGFVLADGSIAIGLWNASSDGARGAGLRITGMLRERSGITARFGVATYREDGATIDELIASAQGALAAGDESVRDAA